MVRLIDYHTKPLITIYIIAELSKLKYIYEAYELKGYTIFYRLAVSTGSE